MYYTYLQKGSATLFYLRGNQRSYILFYKFIYLHNAYSYYTRTVAFLEIRVQNMKNSVIISIHDILRVYGFDLKIILTKTLLTSVVLCN